MPDGVTAFFKMLYRHNGNFCEKKELQSFEPIFFCKYFSLSIFSRSYRVVYGKPTLPGAQPYILGSFIFSFNKNYRLNLLFSIPCCQLSVSFPLAILSQLLTTGEHFWNRGLTAGTDHDESSRKNFLNTIQSLEGLLLRNSMLYNLSFFYPSSFILPTPVS
jgi:hypothetical protein